MTSESPEVVLAIDFSQDQLEVVLHDAHRNWLWPPTTYANDWPGWQQLKHDLLLALRACAPAQVTIVGESTAAYWWHVFYHFSHDPDLQPYHPQLALLNPAHVKHYRRALPEADKDDPSDARLLERYYRQVGVKHFYQFQERYLRLRTLSRAYARVTHTLAAEKAYLLSVLYLWSSAYRTGPNKPFSNLLGATSQYLLTEYTDIQALAALSLDEVAALLQERSGNTFKHPERTARQLLKVIQESYPLPPYLIEPLHQVLGYTLAHIRLLQDNQQAYRDLLEQELATLPEATPALAFRGLGPVLVAGCLSEIGDTRRFVTGTKFDRRQNQYRPRTYRDGQAAVAKLAGLWWPRRDSGRVQGRRPHLARERNTYLRYWFVQAAYTLQRYQPDYRRYYWKKYHEAHVHPHKRAIILTARKAVRLIFALLHKGRLASLEEGPDT
ncbi:MAG: IS110 family transposase [Anaerolineae bacterium]